MLSQRAHACPVQECLDAQLAMQDPPDEDALAPVRPRHPAALMLPGPGAGATGVQVTMA